MPKAIDLTGQTFGRLTVLSLLPTRKNGQRQYRCRCACGVWKPAVLSLNLRSGATESCGCLQREKTVEANTVHGFSRQSGNAHYSRWSDMKKRCNNPNHKNYPEYGYRGISVYPEWNARHSFPAFKAWIDENLGPCPEGYSLDRIDNDGNYEPGNLRWASIKEQNKNRRKRIDTTE